MSHKVQHKCCGSSFAKGHKVYYDGHWIKCIFNCSSSHFMSTLKNVSMCIYVKMHVP